jgi:U3 small nucleolar RNA-associated protein 18
MGKYARKKQKTGKATSEVEPLGTRVSLTDDASKDDEERRLESLLFGTHFVPSGIENADVLVLSDGEEDFMEETGKELEHMEDTDVSL